MQQMDIGIYRAEAGRIKKLHAAGTAILQSLSSHIVKEGKKEGLEVKNLDGQRLTVLFCGLTLVVGFELIPPEKVAAHFGF